MLKLIVYLIKIILFNAILLIPCGIIFILFIISWNYTYIILLEKITDQIIENFKIK